MAHEYKPCPECGHHRIEADIVGGISGVLLRQRGKARGKTTKMIAIVCTFCGHISFFALEPQDLIIENQDTQ